MEDNQQPQEEGVFLGVEHLPNLKDKDCLVATKEELLPWVADFLADKLKHNHKLPQLIYLGQVQLQPQVEQASLTFNQEEASLRMRIGHKVEVFLELIQYLLRQD